MNISAVFQNNQKWAAQKLSHDKRYFQKLARGQNPEMLYIGCSDSRVCAEEFMGLEPGEAFVHRNIANLIPDTDLNTMAVVNYAVHHLKVQNIVVCGHYGCGGVKAAMEDADLGVLNLWLSNIRDVYRLNREELDGIADEALRYDRLVELNVREQCINLMKNKDVRQACKKGQIAIHGWVFDMKSGTLKDLGIKVGNTLNTLSESNAFS